MLLNCSLFSSPSSFRLFLCPSDDITMLLGLLALNVVIYHGVALDYVYPSSFFSYLLPVVTLIFTHLFFVLVLYILPLSLVPALYPTIQSGISQLCTVYLPCYSTGLRLLLSYCFFFRLFINPIPSFFLPTSLMWVFCVSLSHRLEFLWSRSLSLQLHWLPHSPPSNHLLKPYWLTP
jgi:L-asparagine transporter-like permease